MIRVIIFLLIINTLNAQPFEWPRSTPEQVGLMGNHIDAAIDRILAGEVGNMRSLLIIKDGQLITEKYFESSGEKRQVYSVTKSIGAT